MLTASPNSGLPWAELTPFVLAIVVGVVLCLAGRRVMRLAFTAAGFIAGAAGGWVFAQAIDLPVPDWVIIIVPAVVMAAIAAVAYKLTIAVVMAMVLGIAAPLALVTAADIGLYHPTDADSAQSDADQPADAPSGSDSASGDQSSASKPALPDDLEEWLKGVVKDRANKMIDDTASDLMGGNSSGGSAAAELGDDAGKPMSLSPETQERIDRAGEFVKDVYGKAKSRWDAFPSGMRTNLLLSAAVGALLGLLVGALAPTVSASVASAGAGSAICVVAGSIIAARLGAGENDWLPSSSGAWLLLWLVIAIIGLAIQWTTRPKTVDNSRE